MKSFLFVTQLLLLSAHAFSAPLCIVKGKAPSLELIGERHDSGLMKSIEGLDLDDAKAGKVVYAQEGWVKSDARDAKDWQKVIGLNDSQSVGIEEERSYSVGLFIAHYLPYRVALNDFSNGQAAHNPHQMATALLQMREARKNLQEGILRYEFTRKIWEKSFASVPSTLAPDEKPPTTASVAQAWLEEEMAWISIMPNIVSAIATELAIDPPIVDYSPLILIDGLSQNATCTQNNRLITTLVLEWRNNMMSHGIAEAYCEAARQGKGVTALVGAKHLPGLQRLLNQLLPTNVHISSKNLDELDDSLSDSCEEKN